MWIAKIMFIIVLKSTVVDILAYMCQVRCCSGETPFQAIPT